MEFPNYLTVPSELSEDAEDFIFLFENADAAGRMKLWACLYEADKDLFAKIQESITTTLLESVLGTRTKA